MQLAHIYFAGLSPSQDLAGFFIISRVVQGPDKVSAGTPGDDPQSDFRIDHFIIGKKPIDNFIQSTVAAHGNDGIIAIPECLAGKVGGFETTGSKDIIKFQPRSLQIFFDIRPADPGFAVAGGGINDHHSFPGHGRPPLYLSGNGAGCYQICIGTSNIFLNNLTRYYRRIHYKWCNFLHKVENLLFRDGMGSFDRQTAYSSPL